MVRMLVASMGDWPPIVWFTVGLVVAGLLVRFAVWPLLRKIGGGRLWTALKVGIVVALVYVAATVVLAWRVAGQHAALAASEAARADALRGWLSSLTSVLRPMADACADTAMMKLDDVAAVYADPDLTVIEYRTFNSPTVEADEYKDLLTTSPSIGEVWGVTLWRPISYEINLPPIQYYRLARRPYALVIRGEVGGLVDLANNQVVCSGLLPESAAASRDGRKAGVDFTLRPLRAICARVEGNMCALVRPRW